MTVVRRALVPTHCDPIIFRDALAVVIHDSQIVLCAPAWLSLATLDQILNACVKSPRSYAVRPDSKVSALAAAGQEIQQASAATRITRTGEAKTLMRLDRREIHARSVRLLAQQA